MRVAAAQRMFRRAIAIAAVFGTVSAAAIPAAEAQWWQDRPFAQPWHRAYDRPWRPWGPEFHRPWRPVLFRPRPVFLPPPPPPPVRTVVVRPPPPPPAVYRHVIVERTRPVFLQRTVVVHAPPVVIHAPPIVREKIVYQPVPVYVHTPAVHHPVHHYPVIHYRPQHCGCN